ncbi:armadillo-type protein [Globomyces pollinis-pini]|nr:armadillo-type protein [Globomyces pollinis-pini]
MDSELQAQLNGIKQQTNSGLDNQKQAAILLKAVEETIVEQNGELSPIAYFGTLMTIVEQAITNESPVISPSVYLLAIIFPKINANVLKLKFTDIASMLESILVQYNNDAPVVRSTIICIEYLLFAIDNTAWSSETLSKKLFQHLLNLCVDARPKVRKRASDAIKRILSNPPPPTTNHPCCTLAIDFCSVVLEDYISTSGGSKFSKENDSEVLDVLVFLKLMITVFARQSRNDKIRAKLDKLLKALLGLPRRSSGSGDVILTQWVFEVLDTLLNSNNEERLDFKVVDMVVKSLIELSPYENDSILTPTWLAVLTNGFFRLSTYVCDYELGNLQDADKYLVEFITYDYDALFSSFFNRIFTTLYQSNNQIKSSILEKSTVLLSSMIENGVSKSMIEKAKSSNDSTLSQIIQLLEGSLTDIHQRENWGHILLISAAIFRRLGSDSPELIHQILSHIMEFRDDSSFSSSFPYKLEIQTALQSAIQGLGIEMFLSYVPLNIENEHKNQPRRPYLLSNICDALQEPNVTSEWSPYRILGPHKLNFFVSQLLPLSDRMLVKAGGLWETGRELEAKLYETLGLQIWSLFPFICSSLPCDVGDSFGFLAKHLGRVLTTSPTQLYPSLPSSADLRPVVCHGLENLVESFHLLASLTAEDGDDDEKIRWKEVSVSLGKEVIGKIQKYGNRFLSSLCNIYTAIDLDVLQNLKTKGQALQVIHEKSIQHYEKTIKKILLIVDPTSLSDYFMTMVKILLEKQNITVKTEVDLLSIYSILDLVLIMIPFLEKSDLQETPLTIFYNFCQDHIKEKDATFQKKSYKCLTHVLPFLTTIQLNLKVLIDNLLADVVLSNLSPGSTRLRVKLIQLVVEHLEDKELTLYFIPEALPEVMLATKESSEKTRDSAYDCLVAMGHKMIEGGVGESIESLNMNDDESMDESKPHKGDLSIREFIMMVAAGLAGETSHMQSAAIASLGRLLFEFYDSMNIELVTELLKTVLLAMSFKNREVTKAALGFVKVSIVCLPKDVLHVYLESIITTILTHSRDHKSHFKSKVRHIFERLIRKFSYEEIDQHFPQSDKKLILNIKKRKESLKKRKAMDDADGNNGKSVVKPVKEKAFVEAFHDSGSELDSDEEKDEHYIPEKFKDEGKQTSKLKSQTIIREDDVIDFLDKQIVSQVSHVKLSKKMNKTNDNLKKNSDGRYVIDESDSDEDNAKPVISEDYYKQSLASEVSFTRAADGRVKFVKRKRDEDDVEGGEVTTTVGKRWNAGTKKRKEVEQDNNKLLGRQYKAKRAGGDVKRAGMPDPHAFIPLTSKIVGNMNKSTKLDGTLKNILKAAHKGNEIGTKARSIKVKGINKSNKKHK